MMSSLAWIVFGIALISTSWSGVASTPIDFTNAYDDPATGLKCMDKSATVKTQERERLLECTHSLVNLCHYTYETKFKSQREEECQDNYEKICSIVFKQQATNETLEKCYQPMVKQCSEASSNGNELICQTVFESECSTRYVEKSPGKFVGETTCSKIPKELCGTNACTFVPGPEECHNKTVANLVDVPEENCDLVPQKTCRGAVKLVPYLSPTHECANFPKEVCSFGVKGTIFGEKAIVTKWCFDPTETDPFQGSQGTRNGGTQGSGAGFQGTSGGIGASQSAGGGFQGSRGTGSGIGGSQSPGGEFQGTGGGVAGGSQSNGGGFQGSQGNGGGIGGSQSPGGEFQGSQGTGGVVAGGSQSNGGGFQGSQGTASGIGGSQSTGGVVGGSQSFEGGFQGSQSNGGGVGGSQSTGGVVGGSQSFEGGFQGSQGNGGGIGGSQSTGGGLQGSQGTGSGIGGSQSNGGGFQGSQGNGDGIEGSLSTGGGFQGSQGTGGVAGGSQTNGGGFQASQDNGNGIRGSQSTGGVVGGAQTIGGGFQGSLGNGGGTGGSQSTGGGFQGSQDNGSGIGGSQSTGGGFLGSQGTGGVAGEAQTNGGGFQGSQGTEGGIGGSQSNGGSQGTGGVVDGTQGNGGGFQGSQGTGGVSSSNTRPTARPSFSSAPTPSGSFPSSDDVINSLGPNPAPIPGDVSYSYDYNYDYSVPFLDEEPGSSGFLGETFTPFTTPATTPRSQVSGTASADIGTAYGTIPRDGRKASDSNTSGHNNGEDPAQYDYEDYYYDNKDEDKNSRGFEYSSGDAKGLTKRTTVTGSITTPKPHHVRGSPYTAKKKGSSIKELKKESEITFQKSVPKNLRPIIDHVNDEARGALQFAQANGPDARKKAEKGSLAKVIQHKDKNSDVDKTVIIKNVPEAFKVFGIKNVPKELFNIGGPRGEGEDGSNFQPIAATKEGVLSAKNPSSETLSFSEGATKIKTATIYNDSIARTQSPQSIANTLPRASNNDISISGPATELSPIYIEEVLPTDGQAEGIAGGKPGDQFGGQTGQQNGGQFGGQTGQQNGVQFDGQIGQQNGGQFGSQVSRQIIGQNGGQPSGQAGGHIDEQNGAQTGGQAGAQFGSQFNGHTVGENSGQLVTTLNPFLGTTPNSQVLVKGQPSWGIQPVATIPNARPIITINNNGQLNPAPFGSSVPVVGSIREAKKHSFDRNPAVTKAKSFAFPNKPSGPSKFEQFKKLQEAGLQNTIRNHQALIHPSTVNTPPPFAFPNNIGDILSDEDKVRTSRNPQNAYGSQGGATQGTFSPPPTLQYGFRPLSTPSLPYSTPLASESTGGKFSPPNTLMFGFSPLSTATQRPSTAYVTSQSGQQTALGSSPSYAQASRPNSAAVSGGSGSQYREPPAQSRPSSGVPQSGTFTRPRKSRSMVERIQDFFEPITKPIQQMMSG